MDEKTALINRIQRVDAAPAPSERRVARYILQRQSLDADVTVKDIAAACQVSEATVAGRARAADR